MADSSLAQAVAAYKALPRPQRLVLAFLVPAAIAGFAAWKLSGALLKLGPDEGIPAALRRSNGSGVWDEIATVREGIAQKEAVIAERGRIRDQLKALEDDIAAAEERLPREAEKAMMREVIERLARDIPPEVGVVKFRSVRISEDEGAARRAASSSKAELRSLTFQTEVEGDINGIISFIDAIEKNPRFMLVNGIQIRSGEVKPDADARGPKVAFGLHGVRLDLVTYVYSRKGGG